jgi:glycosyltransferase involved in cell wall biosynthesis
MVAPWEFLKRERHDYDFVATEYPASRKARIAHGWRTFRATRSVQAKVYIFHDNDFLPWAWLLHKLLKRPVVYDAHENIPEDILYGKDWIPKPLRRPISTAFRLVEEGVVRALGETVVAADMLHRRFLRQGARVALVRNYPNFNDPGDIANERAVLYSGDLTADYGVCNIIGMAREIKRRGLDLPVRIVDRFRDDEEMRQRIVGIINEEQLPIEILRSVLPDRMPSLLAKGCIGISPSEDFPNKASGPPTKMFEYFLFGLVVVGSDIAGTRTVLADGDLGILCPPRDHVAWVDAFERLLNDPALFEGYRRRAKAAALSRFTWQRERQTLIDYIGKLVENNG